MGQGSGLMCLAGEASLLRCPTGDETEEWEQKGRIGYMLFPSWREYFVQAGKQMSLQDCRALERGRSHVFGFTSKEFYS